MGYVIKLISSNLGTHVNYYGYWTGEQYTVQGELYPICEEYISTKTKIFKSKKIAEKSANACVERYLYVGKAEVEEFQFTS